MSRVKLKLDDDTRAVWETAQRAKAQVERWPAWKRGKEAHASSPPSEPAKATEAVISALRSAVVKRQADAAQAEITAKEAERAAAEAEWRLMVVTDHQPDPDQTVSQRVRAFLEKYPTKKFSPRELMVATRSAEDSVRRVLVSFGKAPAEAAYIRHGHAEYAFDPRHRKPS